MDHVENHQVNSDNIQLYVEDFIDQIYKNPHFTNDDLRGVPKKVINAILTNGFSPPAFRAIVKNLGTTDMKKTIELLPDIYAELDIYLRWQKLFEGPTINQSIDDAKGQVKQQKDIGRKATTCSSCFLFHPNQANTHTDNTWYILHPELSPGGWKRNDKTAAKSNAHDDVDELAEAQSHIAFLSAQLACLVTHRNDAEG